MVVGGPKDPFTTQGSSGLKVTDKDWVIIRGIRSRKILSLVSGPVGLTH